MTKNANTNGFARDINREFTLSDRTHKSTVQYFITKFISDVDWNTNSKNKKITELQDDNFNDYIEHKEHGVILDNDKILQRNRDIEWQQTQLECNEILKSLLTQASEQLFPVDHNISEQTANTLDALDARYNELKKKSA
jgi:hypothetical protein